MDRHTAIRSADIWRFGPITFQRGMHYLHASISAAKKHTRKMKCVALDKWEVKAYQFWTCL